MNQKMPKPKKQRFDVKSLKGKGGECPPFKIQNVVATFNLGVDKLSLRELAQQKPFVEYNPHRFAAATLRLREPKTTALAFASGNMVCTGAKDEVTSRWASRRYVRLLQKHGLPVAFTKFKIQNIVASADTDCAIKLKEIAQKHGPYVSYEPDLFPGLVFRTSDLVFLIFRSGKIVITGAKCRDQISKTFAILYNHVLKKHIDNDDLTKSSSDYRRYLRSQADPMESFDVENFL